MTDLGKPGNLGQIPLTFGNGWKHQGNLPNLVLTKLKCGVQIEGKGKTRRKEHVAHICM